jgi:hypothetical protein
MDEFRSFNEIMKHVKGKSELRLVVMGESVCKKIKFQQRAEAIKRGLHEKKSDLERVNKQHMELLKKYGLQVAKETGLNKSSSQIQLDKTPKFSKILVSSGEAYCQNEADKSNSNGYNSTNTSLNSSLKSKHENDSIGGEAGATTITNTLNTNLNDLFNQAKLKMDDLHMNNDSSDSSSFMSPNDNNKNNNNNNNNNNVTSIFSSAGHAIKNNKNGSFLSSGVSSISEQSTSTASIASSSIASSVSSSSVGVSGGQAPPPPPPYNNKNFIVVKNSTPLEKSTQNSQHLDQSTNLNTTIPFISPAIAHTPNNSNLSLSHQETNLMPKLPLPLSESMVKQTNSASDSFIDRRDHHHHRNSISSNETHPKRTFAQKYFKTTTTTSSRLVRSVSGSSMDLLSNLRLNSAQNQNGILAQHEAAAAAATPILPTSTPVLTNNHTLPATTKQQNLPAYMTENGHCSNTIAKSNSLVNVLNFSKKRSLFNKLNSLDHHLNRTTSKSTANNDSILDSSRLNSSVSSFGTVKVKDKKFFSILTNRPKFLDTPKPHKQQIMPPPSCAIMLASDATKTTPCSELTMVSVDLNGNNIKSSLMSSNEQKQSFYSNSSLNKTCNSCTGVPNFDFTTLTQSFAPLVASYSASSLAQLNKNKNHLNSIFDEDQQQEKNLKRSHFYRSSFSTSSHNHIEHSSTTTTTTTTPNNKFIAKVLSNGEMHQQGVSKHATNSFNRSASYTPNTHNEFKIFKNIRESRIFSNHHHHHHISNNAASADDEFSYQIPVIDYSNKDYVVTRL